MSPGDLAAQVEGLSIDLQRYKKAVKLADVLDAFRITSEVAVTFPIEHREKIADVAKSRSPSQITWTLTVSLLRQREQTRADAIGRLL